MAESFSGTTTLNGGAGSTTSAPMSGKTSGYTTETRATCFRSFILYLNPTYELGAETKLGIVDADGRGVLSGMSNGILEWLARVFLEWAPLVLTNVLETRRYEKEKEKTERRGNRDHVREKKEMKSQ